MPGRGSIGLATTLAVMLAAPATTVAIAPGTNVLISRPLGLAPLTTPTTNDSSVTGGGTGPGSSEAARVVSSAENNRYVAFVSAADGLSGADDDAVTNVYLRDTLTNTVQLISRADGPAGAGADGDSYDPAISATGRYVAFTSEASNLAAGTGSGVSHVYVRDTLGGTTALVDRADGPNGAVANDDSSDPALTVVSGDPRVAFASEADNLDGASTFTQVFTRDFQADDSERVSVVDGTTNTPGDLGSNFPSISADGTAIAFETSATNLIAGPDSNAARDVYLRRPATNDTGIVSLEGVTLGDGDSYGAAINGDGSAVAFVSEATTWAGADDASTDQDVYVRTFNPSDALRLVSRADGLNGTKGNGDSRDVSINDSGQTLVFSSQAANLDSPDTNGLSDVFMRSGTLGATPSTSLISRPAVGVEADGPSTAPSIAGASDGLGNFRVAFETLADNMGADDENDFAQVYSRIAGGAILPPNPARYISRPDGSGVFRSGVNASVLRATTRGSEPVSSTSADGRYTVFMSQADELSDADDNRFVNVFRRDNQTGETMLISRASGAAGLGGNNHSGALDAGVVSAAAPAGAPSISADGNRVAFSSAADNLVGGDTNGRADVFVRDAAAATTTRVSVLPGGGEIAASASIDPAISGDGNRVAFVTGAAIDPQDGNGDGDVYLRDLGAATTTLVSRRGIGAPSGDDTSSEPALDADGSHVAFESLASDLAPASVNDTTPVDPDVYLVPVATGIPQLVNPNPADTTPPINTSDDGAFGPALDADASKVAFASGSTNLGAPGNLAGVDVFVRDIGTAQTELVSRTDSAPSVSGNGSSEAPSIDAAGQQVAFESVASNLVAGDVNGAGSDVFVRDLIAGTTTLAARTPTGAQPVLGSEAASLSANGDCLMFQSTSDALFPMPPGTDFSKIFGRALRGDCPFEPVSGGGGGGGGGAVDTDPPETTISKQPKKKSPKAKAKLAFTSDEPGSTFECALKGKGVKKKLKKFKPCDSGTAKYKKLKDGKKKFRVRATDAAGNVDPSPAKAKWKVT
jgi:Tol biopolymer transport system component